MSEYCQLNEDGEIEFVTRDGIIVSQALNSSVEVNELLETYSTTHIPDSIYTNDTLPAHLAYEQGLAFQVYSEHTPGWDLQSRSLSTMRALGWEQDENCGEKCECPDCQVLGEAINREVNDLNDASAGEEVEEAEVQNIYAEARPDFTKVEGPISTQSHSTTEEADIGVLYDNGGEYDPDWFSNIDPSYAEYEFPELACNQEEDEESTPGESAQVGHAAATDTGDPVEVSGLHSSTSLTVNPHNDWEDEIPRFDGFVGEDSILRNASEIENQDDIPDYGNGILNIDDYDIILDGEIHEEYEYILRRLKNEASNACVPGTTSNLTDPVLEILEARRDEIESQLLQKIASLKDQLSEKIFAQFREDAELDATADGDPEDDPFSIRERIRTSSCYRGYARTTCRLIVESLSKLNPEQINRKVGALKEKQCRFEIILRSKFENAFHNLRLKELVELCRKRGITGVKKNRKMPCVEALARWEVNKLMEDVWERAQKGN